MLYGSAYSRGVAWGVTAAVLAMAVNVFALGNRTLQEGKRLPSQLVALSIATLAIAIGLVLVVRMSARELWPLGWLIVIIGGRGLFWLITDIWCDYKVFKWHGAGVKVRGLTALAAGLVVIYQWPGSQWQDFAVRSVAGFITFWLIFRALGGLGEPSRNLLSRQLGRSASRFLRWVCCGQHTLPRIPCVSVTSQVERFHPALPTASKA
jgi:hypothetical protein